MASYQAKTGRKMLWMWERKFTFWSIPTRPGIWNSRQKAKKFKKLKIIIMASFQAKTERDRLRMRETKNCSYQFLANPEFIILKK